MRRERIETLIVAGLAVVAALLYGFTVADFAYPGESARLLAHWTGGGSESAVSYPIFSVFARLFGGGNWVAPVCGVLAVVGLYRLLSSAVRCSMLPVESSARDGVWCSRVAGLVAAGVFLLTPAVRSAATHAEPRLFFLVWILTSLAILLPWQASSGWRRTARQYIFAVFWGFGISQTPTCLFLLPQIVLLLLAFKRKNGGRSHLVFARFALGAFAAYALFTSLVGDGFVAATRVHAAALRNGLDLPGSRTILCFAALPFIVTVLALRSGLSTGFGWGARAFHLGLGVISILTVATPLAPSAAAEAEGTLPVVACFFVAVTAGYLAAWWSRAAVRCPAGGGRLFARVALGALSAVWLLSALVWTISYDARRGAFADALAERAVADLGERTWLVTDGSLDSHLLLAAHRCGKALELVSLAREDDLSYRAQLAERVAASGLAPERRAELRRSLALGVLPFVEDALSSNTNAASRIAVFSAPDLWYGAERTPVPETLFYGADPSRPVEPDALTEALASLEAPAGWGSHRFARLQKDPIRRFALGLRRHLGRVANDRAVWLQEQGRADEAFSLYRRVIDEIDSDNLSALFNLYEMAQAKHPAAVRRQAEFEKRLKAVVADKTRRYELWSLASYYGYIRNPGLFLRLGYNWARSGRPGEARSQIRRALDFMPADRRSGLMNMLAALYADEDDRAASRAAYEAVLAKNAADRDALLGLARLSAAEGDTAGALGYLDRAVAAGGDDPRMAGELALAALLRGDAAKARTLLLKATAAKPDDLRLQSLLAAATMQLADAAKDAKARAGLEWELEQQVLPELEKQSGASKDYHVQTTRGFLALRKGPEHRQEARDAFVLAAQARPDVAATREIVLGLDISLNDAASAEAHAREALKLNRRAPTANYVMGSIALGKGSLEDAEAYLRRACEAARPNPLALNDLAEVCRRKKSYAEAEGFARRAIAVAPGLYVAHETLGTVILERGGDAAEAEKCIQKACDLSKDKGRPADIRMLVSLARAQLARGDKRIARVTLRQVEGRLKELSDFERREYEELAKRAQ